MKKTISLILSVVLVFSLFSITVFADEQSGPDPIDIESEQEKMIQADHDGDINNDHSVPAIEYGETEESFDVPDDRTDIREDEGVLSASSGKCGDNLTWELSDEGVLRISGTGKMYDWTIDPDHQSPWYEDKGITNVIIDAGVTSIGSHAFMSCDYLSDITIPDSVTTIGDCAFAGCGRLTHIELPKSLISIGDSAFSSCRSISEVTIPDTVTSIGKYAFYYCIGLTSITIPEGVVRIKGTFDSCTNLTSITLPDSLTEIGDATFRYCSSLTGISIPDSVQYIGYDVFYCCRSLTDIKLPEGLTDLEESVFYGCESLTGITLPESLKVIWAATFYNCKSLAGITIPDGVSYIGQNAFRNCEELTACYIYGKNVHVVPNAFANAGNVTIYCSPNSNVVDFANKKGIPCITDGIPFIPDPVAVNKAETGCTIKWGESPEASGYDIYRQVGSADIEKVKTINDGSTLEWTDINADKTGMVYTYYVAAYINKDGEIYKSGKSDPALFYYVKRPTLKSVTQLSFKEIEVSWKDNPQADGFEIYRQVGSGKFKKVLTVTDGSTSWIDLGAKVNGAQYSYYVVAYSEVDGKTFFSEPSATKYVYYLKDTQIRSLTNSASKTMTVKWVKNTKATGYQVQYATTESFSVAKTSNVAENTAGTKISGLKKGKIYYVRVRTYKTVNGKKYYSDWSNVKKVKIRK